MESPFFLFASFIRLRIYGNIQIEIFNPEEKDMFCPNCGSPIPEGNRFCTNCGTPISVGLPETPVQTAAPVQPAQPTQTPPPTEVVKETREKKPANPKRTRNIIIIAAAAAVVIAAVVVCLLLFLPKKAKNAYVYLADESLNLITDLEKGRSVEISSGAVRGDSSSYYASPFFSEDGKYLYYYTDYNTDSGTGTLCAADYNKLSDDRANNGYYIDVIASDVIPYCVNSLKNGTLVYLNNDRTLYYYDGKSSAATDYNVNYFYTDSQNRAIYYSGEYGKSDLFAVSLDNIEDKTKLDTNVNYILKANDLDDVVYEKYDEDGNASIYSAGFNNPAHIIAENANVIRIDDESVMYIAKTGSVSLYSFVDDDKADADKNIKEPNLDDYEIPYYYYEIISADSAKESDYTELYTSCTKPLYWYGASTWCYSMEEALGMTWNGDEESTKAIVKATQDFIDKYGAQADEDGYILVTPEIKDELIKIDKSSGNDGDYWIYLCLSRKQQGTTYDYDAYYEVYDKYYEAKGRIDLRQELQNPENDHYIYDICRYKDCQSTQVAQNVFSYDSYSGNVVIYNTVDMIDAKVKIDEISSTYDVWSALNLDWSKENYIISMEDGSAPVKLTSEAAGVLGEIYPTGANVYVVDGTLFLDEYGGKLYAASYSSDEIGSLSLINDNSMLFYTSEGDVYYFGNIHDNNGYNYGDFYRYKDGNDVLIANDTVCSNQNYVYEDDVILSYSDTGYSGYNMTMYDQNGNATKIADNVTRFIRVDKDTILYISDYALYRFDGKTSEIIKDYASDFWCLDYMKPEYFRRGY